ncbi:MAG: hypothetical protein U0X75_17435 [Acidobacteriota bacterium]
MKLSEILLVAACLTLLFACRQTTPPAQIEGFLLTGEEAKLLVGHCTTVYSAGVEAYWTPNQTDLRQLEHDLNSYLASPNVDGLNQYLRQYAGVIKNGRKQIVDSGVQAAIAQRLQNDQPMSDKAIVLCGGGTMMYGVEYDVETRSFSSFTFNAAR